MPFISKGDAKSRKRVLKRMRKKGLIAPVTVVAATRLLPRAAWPQDRDFRLATVEDALNVSLVFLNEYLLSLSLLTTDVRWVSITRGDLPSACPFILEATLMSAYDSQ